MSKPSPSTGESAFKRFFFAPVYFFIEKVRFARSLLLLLLLLPDGYVAYLLVKQTSKDVDFSRKESVGVEYITPVRALLSELQDLRVELIGSGDVEDNKKLIDDKVGAVTVVDTNQGDELQVSKLWGELASEWKTISGRPFATPGDRRARDQEVAKLTGRIATDLIINGAGNNSNLILDPDLDSYWLMDAFVIKLPLLGELVASAAVGAAPAIWVESFPIDQRLGVAGTLGLIEATTNDLLNVNLASALANNKSGRIKGKLEEQFKGTAKQLRDFSDLIKASALVPSKSTLITSELQLAASRLVTSVHALQKEVGPELNQLCVDRAVGYEWTRFVGLLVFLAAALLISYVFNGFTSSVKNSQQKILDENERLQKDILGMLTVVSEAADGDLTARAKVTEGTLGNVADAFNQMMESWQTLMGEINQQLDRTNHAVAELGRTAVAMAQGASNQATAVGTAAGAVQRMSQEISQVSSNAEDAASAAKRTQQSAQQGSQSVQDVVRGMESLRSLVQAGAKKIKALGERSMEINSIVGTIAKISEQTNMLALNAAIEAARAGDQGRGFSVVADEVRKLAERTAVATQEIDKLVKSIQVETNESVSAIERQTQVVEDEGRAVAKAGSVLTKIEEVSGESTTLAGSIAIVAKTHVGDAISVVSTMQGVSGIAKETESNAQNSLAIARNLGELSEQLRASIGRFRIG